MTSRRPERDFEGAGVNISLAIAGVVAAGVGLLTMHTAFKPLPKPGVPIVISHAVIAPTAASWRHTRGVHPAVRSVSTRFAQAPQETTPAPSRSHQLAPKGHQEVTPAPSEEEPGAAPANLAAAVPKAPVQTLAKAEVSADKLCKAPAPAVLSAKSLQPVMILRYDSRFKAPTPDIEPQRFPSDDEQRRLKLSQLLSRVLAN